MFFTAYFQLHTEVYARETEEARDFKTRVEECVRQTVGWKSKRIE